MKKLVLLKAIALVGAKVCKIQKVLNFAHFNKKNTYINTCKNVQIYKTATVTVHICTVTVHVQMIFLFFFSLFPSSCSLIWLLLATKKEKGGWGHVGSGLFDIIKN